MKDARPGHSVPRRGNHRKHQRKKKDQMKSSSTSSAPHLYGSPMGEKLSGLVRIVFQNVHGFPKEYQDPRNQQWLERLAEYNLDVFLSAEDNINWTQTSLQNSLAHRCRRFWSSSRCISTWNRLANSDSQHLPGGASVILRGDISHRSTASGEDSSRLGRWAWTKLRGPQDATIIVVSAYAPPKTKFTANSVAGQHLTALRSRDDDRSPAAAFYEDLGSDISQWHANGWYVILGMDANRDVESEAFVNWYTGLALSNFIVEAHGPQPATFARGTRPIDCILSSFDLTVCKGGLISIGDAFDSDHAGVWMDVDLSEILGNISLAPRSEPKRLTVTDEYAVARYISSYESFIKRNKLVEACLELVRLSKTGWDTHCESKMEDIDRLRVSGMLESESTCRKLRTGAIPWSPALTTAYNNKRYVELCLRARKGQYVASSTLRRAKKRGTIIIPPRTSLDGLKEIQRSVCEALRAARTEGKLRRDAVFKRIASRTAARIGQEARGVFKSLQGRARSKYIFQAIRGTFKSRSPKVVSLAAFENGILKESFTKEEVEHIALAEGEKRFRQTERTPFMLPALSNRLGFHGEGPEAEEVLTGKFRAPDEDVYTQEYIAALQRPDHVIERSAVITKEEWSGLWSRSAERTACGDSGLHFAHFKANCKSKHALMVDLTLASLSYLHGYPLQRWERSINVFLQKKTPSPLASKHRIIHLWEADANGLFKILSRHTLEIANTNGMIAPEQYAKPEHSAGGLSLAKRLTLDISRQKRQTIAMCCNDMKQNYDRIVHTPAALALRRVGIKAGPINCMFRMIQNLAHFVKTGHGISTACFSRTIHIAKDLSAIPIQGIGQGNGCGPASWVVVSSPILDMLRNRNIGWQTVSPITNTVNTISSFSYVDDTDTIEGARMSSDNHVAVTGRLQKAMEVWCGGIQATGGEISPEKSFWMLIDYKFRSDGTPVYRRSSEAPAMVHMTSVDGTVHEIQRIEPNEAIMTLGVLLAADGNQKRQKEHLKQKIHDWCTRAKRRKLRRDVLSTALHSSIARTIAYPAAVTTFSKIECDEIISELRKTVLPLLGYNSSMPLCIVHAPVENGGLGFPDLYAEQLSQRAKLIAEHGLSDTLTGRLIRTSTELLKLEIGIGEPLHDTHPHLWSFLTTDCWMKSAWMDSHDAGLAIIDKTPNLKLLCEDDSFINEEAMVFSQTEADRKAIQRCRMYFQVSCSSELFDGSGKKIQARFRAAQRGRLSKFSVTWPRQRQPTLADHRVWVRFLDWLTIKHGGEVTTFGSWKPGLTFADHQFDLLECNGIRLYRRKDCGWSVWRPSHGHRESRGSLTNVQTFCFI